MSFRPPSLVQRVRDTFAAPRRLFATFRHAAPWFDVLLISTAVAALASAARPAESFLEQMEDPVNRLGRPVTVTSPPADIVRWGRILAAFSALVGHPIVAFALAGILALIFTVLGGGRASFRQYLAVVSHALLIAAAGVLLRLLALLVSGRRLPGGLGAAAPWLDPGSTAARLLTAVDPFVIWMVLVLAAGVEQLDGRRGWARAAVLLLALYIGTVGLAVVAGG